jgi:hypothetical protein
MNIDEEKFGWKISLTECFVTQIQIDFRVGLLVSNSKDAVRVSPFQFRERDGVEALITPEQTVTVAPLLSTHNTKVNLLSAGKNGVLRIDFDNGSSIVAEPDKLYEAWQINAGDNLFICGPGGKISRFG